MIFLKRDIEFSHTVIYEPFTNTYNGSKSLYGVLTSSVPQFNTLSFADRMLSCINVADILYRQAYGQSIECLSTKYDSTKYTRIVLDYEEDPNIAMVLDPSGDEIASINTSDLITKHSGQDLCSQLKRRLISLGVCIATDDIRVVLLNGPTHLTKR
jgi:hypothetical protein